MTKGVGVLVMLMVFCSSFNIGQVRFSNQFALQINVVHYGVRTFAPEAVKNYGNTHKCKHCTYS